jgi:signal transduction histidine kinase/ligand-binding sensor domain-containing protein
LSGSLISREIRLALFLCIGTALCHQVLFALDPHRAIGQYIVTRWGLRESFPGGPINAIAQTPDGYLWIGAQNGLVRFDGISFRLLEHDNTPSLPAGHVLGLAVDSEGVLWVRMESPYLMRYRGGNFEQMYPVPLPAPLAPAREQDATAVTRGTRGDILIAPPDGPLRYSGGKVTPVVSSGMAGGLAISIAETADGAVWVGMRDTGLFCVRYGRLSQVTGLPDQKVNVLLPGAGPDLWIGTDSGLVRWDGSAITRRGVPAELARSSILALARDRDFNVWASTPAGITRIDSNGTGAHLPGTVHAIFEDREGNLWFGGTEELMQLRDAPFLSYTGLAGEGGSLYVDASGRTWIGPSSGGLLWVRGAERHLITAAGMDRDVIYSISGGPGELWVGRRLGGITQLREEAGVLYPRTYTAGDGLAQGTFYAVHRARDGSVWAGTLTGAVSRIQKGRVTTFTSGDGLSADAVTTIQEGRDGVIWIGTAGGLAAFRNGKWKRYSGEDGLPPGRVNSIVLDGDGVLWIGSSSGLYYWSGTRFESARNAPDSLHAEIYALAADQAGNLWAATDRHVVSISRAPLLGQSKVPGAVREFGRADGLPSTRGIRRDHSVVNDPSGRIWFSLQGGICVVYPSLSSALTPAPVNVESVAVDGRELGTGPAARYPSNRQRVVFNFIAVSLAVPGRVRYRYLLDGYDPDWSQPTESREAAYTRLPPARYTFRVMASNSEGLWNGAAASVPFEVEPQLLETRWFRVTALLVTAAVIFGGFRYRMARFHAAMHLRFEERLAERTRIARDLHDGLLQSLAGVSLQLHGIAKTAASAPEKTPPQIEKIRQQVDATFREARSKVYNLRSPALEGQGLADALGDFIERLGPTATAHCTLHVSGEPVGCTPEIEEELLRITQEATHNANRHAGAKEIRIALEYGGRSLKLSISDDGCGFRMEEGLTKSGHWGLKNMQERAASIRGKCTINSAPGQGTQIDVYVPLRRWSFRKNIAKRADTNSAGR